MCSSLVTISAVGLTVGATFAYMHHNREDHDTSKRIILALESIRSPEDVIRLLQRWCRRSPTEDVVHRLSIAVRTYGIVESTLTRLSNMHREWGHDLGIKGYAITLVWSSVLHALQDESGGIILVDDCHPVRDELRWLDPYLLSRGENERQAFNL